MTDFISVFPKATEKAYGLSKNNVYVFEVPVIANKQQIVDAIESQYGVKIVNIKTLVQSGKVVRANRGKRNQPGKSQRKDMKKAYVKLADGDSIKVFEEEDSKSTATKIDKKPRETKTKVKEEAK